MSKCSKILASSHDAHAPTAAAAENDQPAQQPDALAWFACLVLLLVLRLVLHDLYSFESEKLYNSVTNHHPTAMSKHSSSAVST